ncbi:MAG TPA: dTDP-4-dehydrorhamnose 3,5-epimerase [Planctomycetaceae bacterium]|jgi:dTDP-4-dehydrorhamnose 3,5-epimerase|nr:dTDP-4-dehydrorhamnose 3,5-epimerase [Planctomycetaceae bacterium]
MKFTETWLAGAYLIDIEPREDERGFFARTFCRREFEDHGLEPNLLQCSVSFNRCQGTIRGIHFQRSPYQETKIVRCTAGAIFDVIVDLRADSPTFLKYLAVELTAENRRALYVPKDFAHGFQTLAEETEVAYQMSEFYAPNSAAGLRWNDPLLAIEWPLPVSVISQQDAASADFQGGGDPRLLALQPAPAVQS